MLVILDPAHQKLVAGKRSPDGKLLEYLWSRELIGMIEKRLDEIGIEHVRTSPPSEDNGKEIGLLNRCKRANAFAKTHNGKSIFISPHVNAAGNGKWMNARGWSVFISPTASSNSKKLASLMAIEAGIQGIKVRVPDPDHKYWTAKFTVLQKTSMPAILIENLFMDNEDDVNYLLSDNGKETLCEIIIKGICDYFNIEYNYGRE